MAMSWLKLEGAACAPAGSIARGAWRTWGPPGPPPVPPFDDTALHRAAQLLHPVRGTEDFQLASFELQGWTPPREDYDKEPKSEEPKTDSIEHED
jgi:hypothetical protein